MVVLVCTAAMLVGPNNWGMVSPFPFRAMGCWSEHTASLLGAASVYSRHLGGDNNWGEWKKLVSTPCFLEGGISLAIR